MEHDEPRVGTRRPGGRTARTRAAVLDAVIEVLAESGYAGLTHEEVARRAGVHKTTVYRRWPTMLDLVAEATRARSEEAVPVPDTGSLLGDLTALARSVAANLASELGGLTTRHLVASAVGSPELAAGMHAFWAHRLGLTGEIVERAVARGEVAAAVDVNLLLESLIGPLFVRLLLTGEPITTQIADAVAARVAAAYTIVTPAGGA